MASSITTQLHRQHSPNTLLTTGTQLLHQRKYDAAIEAFTAVIDATKPASAPIKALEGRAFAQQQLNNLDAALSDARRMIKLYESDPSGYIRGGRILELDGKSEMATQLYGYGLKKCPEVDSPLYKKLFSHVLVPKYIDPFVKLPFELLQIIFSFTPFSTRCVCLRVCRSWRASLISDTSLWHSIDLSGANRPVRGDDALKLVKLSKGRAREIILKQLPLQGTRILERMTTYCKSLERLSIITGGELSTTVMKALQSCQSLTTLHLGSKVIISMQSAAEIAGLCPVLVDLQLDKVVNETHGLLTPHVATKLSRFSMTGSSLLFDLDLSSLIIPTTSLRDLEVFHPSSDGTIDLTHFLSMTLNLQTIRTGVNCECEFDDNSWFFGRLGRSIKTIDITNTGFLATGPDGSESYHEVHDWQQENGETYFHSLQSLQVSESSQLDVDNVNALLLMNDSFVGPPSHLERLAIRAPQVSSLDLTSILQQPRLTRLKSLDLSLCQDFVDANATVIAASMKHLRKLDLSRTRVTGVGIKALVDKLPDLHHLTLKECGQVGNDAVEWARKKGLVVPFCSPRS